MLRYRPSNLRVGVNWGATMKERFDSILPSNLRVGVNWGFDSFTQQPPILRLPTCAWA